jgi:tRNA (cmo5U34)-methyltransferase
LAEHCISLKEKFSDLNYTGVDFAEKSIEKCKTGFGEYGEFIFSDIIEYDFPSNLDSVISVLTIHHLDKDEKNNIYKKTFDSLNEGGLFIIGDIVDFEDVAVKEFFKKARADYRSGILNEEEVEEMKQHLQDYPHVFETSRNTINSLEEIGFKKVDIVWSNFGMMVFRAVK